MNTIKFTSVFDMRHETHNVEVFEAKQIELNDKIYEVEDHASLMVYPTIKCNSKCEFCLNKLDKSLVDCRDIGREEYMEKLSSTLDVLGDIKPRISICGGEPTITDMVKDILELVHDKGFKFRTFPTNGTGLLRRIDGVPIIEWLNRFGFIDNINLSYPSFKEEVLGKIMGNNGYISEKQLRHISSYCDINGIDLRLSCILLKEGVNDLRSMVEFVKKATSIGITSCMFRELVQRDHESKVTVESILNDIEGNEEFKPIRVLSGSYYDVYVYSWMDSILKCYKEKKLNDSKGKIRDFVFYSNGELYASYKGTNGIENVKVL